VLEYKKKLNPFTKWKMEFKEFDWDNMYAELTQASAYNTVTYQVRSVLWLTACEPGTTRVKDRIAILPATNDLRAWRSSWAYIRQYMEKGLTGLRESCDPNSKTFINCVLWFYPYLDPTEVGRRRREVLGSNFFIWLIYTIIFLLTFWLLIPIGILEYIALKVAPKAQWPKEAEQALM
jgi:hypothetical protein